MARNIFKVFGLLVLMGAAYMTLTALTREEFLYASKLLVPSWISARSAEVFKVATIWALKMQYGGRQGSLGLL